MCSFFYDVAAAAAATATAAARLNYIQYIIIMI